MKTIEAAIGVKMDLIICWGVMAHLVIQPMITDIHITIVRIRNIIRLMNKNKRAKFDLENPKF